MKAIWKYPLLVKGVQTFEIPLPATALTVQVQHGQPCLWAEVDPDGTKALVTIIIVGTGHPMPEGRLRYISTFQIDGGALVFHAYETLNEVQ